MYTANVTNDYDKITSSNYTDYDNMTGDYNCTNNDNIIEIVKPLITIIPCGMSLICLISLMVYTLMEPLFNKKYYLSNINGEVSLSNSSSSLYYNRT